MSSIKPHDALSSLAGAPGLRVLHVGASGLVGRHALALLLASPDVAEVVAPTRRALDLEDPKLLNPVVDFDNLPKDASWWAVDAVVCTLGSTIRKAGSRVAFRKVDFEYPLQFARLAYRHGARSFALNSAMGANPESRVFYNRVKGDLEAALQHIGFQSLTCVRPGLIGGDRDEFRFGEHLVGIALSALAPLLPRRYRINPAVRIAAALVDAACHPRPGTWIIPSERLL